MATKKTKAKGTRKKKQTSTASKKKTKATSKKPAKAKRKPSRQSGPAQNPKIAKALILYCTSDAPLSVDQVAEEFGLSVTYLKKVATKEKWVEQRDHAQSIINESEMEVAIEDAVQIRGRHRKQLRVIQSQLVKDIAIARERAGGKNRKTALMPPAQAMGLLLRAMQVEHAQFVGDGEEDKPMDEWVDIKDKVDSDIRKLTMGAGNQTKH